MKYIEQYIVDWYVQNSVKTWKHSSYFAGEEKSDADIVIQGYILQKLYTGKNIPKNIENMAFEEAYSIGLTMPSRTIEFVDDGFDKFSLFSGGGQKKSRRRKTRRSGHRKYH